MTLTEKQACSFPNEDLKGFQNIYAMTDTDTVVAPPKPDIDLDFVVMDDEELEKPFRVIIHNDDVTPMDFVVVVLINIFELEFQRAVKVMYEAHAKGKSLVTVLSYQEANRRVYNAQTAARAFNYPLSFTLEEE